MSLTVYILDDPYHIRVIPVTWSGIRLELVLTVTIVINDPQDTIPAVGYVIKVTPQVAIIGYHGIVGLQRIGIGVL